MPDTRSFGATVNRVGITDPNYPTGLSRGPAVTAVTGSIGPTETDRPPSMTFFESLNKPDWIPPDWAFPAAWFSLWLLQAIALVILLGRQRPETTTAVVLLIAQFVFAVAWQAAVFGPGRLTLAAWWLVGVLVLVVAATIAAGRVSTLAGALIAPTIVWVSVATALGFSLLRLNPGA